MSISIEMEEYVSMSIWQTSIEETETQLSGPFRAPQQMLAEQEYDGHLSIHDDSQAILLGYHHE